MSNVKIWLATGASSGFGRAMTEYLLEVGHKVIATLRNLEALSDLTARYPPTQLLVVKVDVTNKADITAAFAKAEDAFGRIDVVFNNAGIVIASEVESTDEANAREMFEINFWGAAHVSQEAVRFFREVNKPVGGRLLQVSSGLALVVDLLSGSTARVPLEGLSECLASELDPAWNIKVTILEPGPYRTDIFGKNSRVLPQHPAYTDPALPVTQSRKYIASAEALDGDVTKAVIEKFSKLEDVPMRFPLHRRVVAFMRDKAKDLSDVADAYESWTEDDK